MRPKNLVFVQSRKSFTCGVTVEQIVKLLLIGAIAATTFALSVARVHSQEVSVDTAVGDGTPDSSNVTGSGEFRFRYHAELSKLPKNIAAGIAKAHGGFAKTPSGEIYVGLNGTGLIRVWADLKTKTLVSKSDSLVKGGLHNCTHVNRDGGFLVLPDNRTGRILMVQTDGTKIKTLGRPPFLGKGKFAPTDVAAAGDSNLYVCDGYGVSKSVFTIDLDQGKYGELKFGGAAGPGKQPSKFSTNHGIVFDNVDNTLIVADRERQWLQKLTHDGEFVRGIKTDHANPCDVDFCLLYTSPSPRDRQKSRMPSSA